jgi:hypothetical protein
MNVAMCYLSFLFPEANFPVKRGENDFMPLNQTSVVIEMTRIGEGGRGGLNSPSTYDLLNSQKVSYLNKII